jgi:hypothetical protein
MLKVITTRQGHLNFKTKCNTRNDKSLRKQTGERERERETDRQTDA